MLDIIIAILYGAVQGITEFLPISSSGHLVVLHEVFFGFKEPLVAFDVVLHLGTFVALLGFFYADIIKYLQAFVRSFFDWQVATDSSERLSWFLFIGTIPAALAGYFFETQIETIFRSTTIVASMLIGVGVLLYLVDRFAAKSKTIEQVTLHSALLVGVAQALALVPGVSRSGITIVAGLTQKLNRANAARFSFLLSIPIVFGAGIKKVLDLSTVMIGADELIVLVTGFVSAAIVGYLCIKYFLLFLQRHSLAVFAYYRIALGIIILLFL